MNFLYAIHAKLNIRPSVTSIFKVIAAVFLPLLAFTDCSRKDGNTARHSDISAIRKEFDEKSENTNKALEKHVPQGISAVLNQQYDGADKATALDVYFPAEAEKSGKALPVIVWIHGGGWVSGDKSHVANYCKILAGKGYTTVSVNYSLAPESTFPTPVRQVNKALEYLAGNAARLHIDPSHFVLAGDSGGASIAAQLANAISLPSYAEALNIAPAIPRAHLSGVLLYCGPYEMADADRQEYGQAVSTFLKAYSGTDNYKNNQKFAAFKVVRYVTTTFPPAFISAGNADPLLPSSQDLARTLSAACVKVDTVFFTSDHQPAQNHEFQFNLESEEGKIALNRSMIFLSGLGLSKPE